MNPFISSHIIRKYPELTQGRNRLLAINERLVTTDKTIWIQNIMGRSK